MSRIQPTSIPEALAVYAVQRPDHPVFTFLDGRGAEVAQVTFFQLEQRARRIASALMARGFSDKCVALLFPPGLEFIESFFGCLLAGAIAVPAYPPRRNAHAGRIEAIIRNARASLILTVPAEKEKLARQSTDFPFLSSIECWAPQAELEETPELPLPELKGDRTAFLQYTSGSTGTPKGVMVSLDNLYWNVRALAEAGRFDSGSRMVSWLPAFHDMGLISGILMPVLRGAQGFLMAPITFVTRPLVWAKILSGVRGTHIIMPNFAFDHCVDCIHADDLEGLDFQSLQLVGNSAEPIQLSSIERFYQLFKNFGLAPTVISTGYGLAEATLIVSASSLEEENLVYRADREALAKGKLEWSNKANARLLVSSGKALDGAEIRIVEPGQRVLCAEEEIGEIWIKGPTVAGGYWQNEKETEGIFNAVLQDTGDGPYLRSGDLGFFWRDELFLTGRIKEVIILQGANYYPQDLELTARQFNPDLFTGVGAAFSVEVEGVERLVVVQETNRSLSREPKERLKEYCEQIAGLVSREHEIEVYLVVLTDKSAVPRTSSGKIQRGQCRDLLLSGQLPVLASDRGDRLQLLESGKRQAVLPPSTALPTQGDMIPPAMISEIFYEALASVLEREAQQLSPVVNFKNLGLTSIKAARLAQQLSRKFHREISPTWFFEAPTPGQFLEKLLNEFHMPGAIAAVQKPALSSVAPPPQGDIDFNDLSEEELAELLRKEVEMIKSSSASYDTRY